MASCEPDDRYARALSETGTGLRLSIRLQPGASANRIDGFEVLADGQAVLRARVTAAPDVIPEKLLQQLAPGGRLIIPVGPQGVQDLVMITKRNDHFEQVSLGAVTFVPLVKGNS